MENSPYAQSAANCKIRRVDFSPDEWLGGNIALGNAERGLLWTACALITSRGGPVSVEELKSSCRDHGNAINAQLKRLLAAGKLVLEGDLISQARALCELEVARKRVEKARENGRKGGRKPRENGGESSEIKDVAKPGGFQPSTTNYKEEDSVVAYAPTDAGKPASTLPPEAEPDPVKDIFDRGVAILGARNRALLGKMRKQFGDTAVLHAITQTEAEHASEPVAYFIGCCQNFAQRTPINAAKRPLSPAKNVFIGGFNAALNIPPSAEAYRNYGNGLGTDDALLDGRGDDQHPRGADAFLARCARGV